MLRLFTVLMFLFLTWGLSAQAPQPRLVYEDRAGTTGHTLVLDGKSFGPYKEVVSVVHSTSGMAGLFLATKRDKTYIVAQGKEAGPISGNYEPDQTYISDDGKVAAVMATVYHDDEDGTSETELWVNGKLYGPYVGIYPFEYAENGGNWIASVQVGEENYNVLLNGKTQGPFTSVDMVWMSPDGKSWGYAVRDEEGILSVYTQDRKYEKVESGNFDQAYPRSAHWGYGVRLDGEQEVIVIDGKEYKGYLNYYGLYVTPSGRHWGFAAEKMTDAGDYPVVVIDGKEYVGESLGVTSLGMQESFTWTVQDGNKVTVQVLALP